MTLPDVTGASVVGGCSSATGADVTGTGVATGADVTGAGVATGADVTGAGVCEFDGFKEGLLDNVGLMDG